MLSGRSEINAHVASPPFSFIELDNPNIRKVANSADILGDMTLVMSATPKRFHDANPLLCKAYLAALAEANQMIATDPQAAADTYNEVSPTKVSNSYSRRQGYALFDQTDGNCPLGFVHEEYRPDQAGRRRLEAVLL
jgi:ABC-type nitrate/sulfonate/bicarbonate transport system substrate-binding protein